MAMASGRRGETGHGLMLGFYMLRSGETKVKQRSLARQTVPPSRGGSGGARGSRQRQAERRSREQAVTQPQRLPRERFTTSPIPRCLLDGASKAIPGLYFIVTFICKGCQSGPGRRLPCCSRLFVTHAQRCTLTGTRVQGHLETPRARPGAPGHAHTVDTQTWSARTGAVA